MGEFGPSGHIEAEPKAITVTGVISSPDHRHDAIHAYNGIEYLLTDNTDKRYHISEVPEHLYDKINNGEEVTATLEYTEDWGGSYKVQSIN